MAARRRIDPAVGAQALRQWAQEHDETQEAPGDGAASTAGAGGDAGSVSPADRAARRRITATAVRYTLEELAACAPGRSVEVRVPPFGVTQAVAGTVHRRGTPPSVVETDASTWLALATGRLTWQDALASGALQASGERCDLSAYLPLVRF
ncbi:hypothetical protein E4J66_10235 [Actinomyces viscosus]|uniref:Bacterial SCP orthologue domain-containing protein n=1 Tax=Actinomyces viscosus TaxID=1656 RepID=A0A3S5EWG7_ACTVI|nr:sterol carrier family protein [Actinomyces viscosus]TFH51903.1 hypothetical protein E4J66_10235 [Actinomyces viscosus]VEI16636.1 Uncharacterised protein [Actinomyces viscosus]